MNIACTLLSIKAAITDFYNVWHPNSIEPKNLLIWFLYISLANSFSFSHGCENQFFIIKRQQFQMESDLILKEIYYLVIPYLLFPSDLCSASQEILAETTLHESYRDCEVSCIYWWSQSLKTAYQGVEVSSPIFWELGLWIFCRICHVFRREPIQKLKGTMERRLVRVDNPY